MPPRKQAKLSPQALLLLNNVCMTAKKDMTDQRAYDDFLKARYQLEAFMIRQGEAAREGVALKKRLASGSLRFVATTGVEL